MKKTVAILPFLLFACINLFAAGGDDAGMVHKGDKAFRRAELGKALSFYLKALEVNPQDCYANFQAGAIYYLTDSARMKSLAYFENTIKYAKPIKDDTIIDAYYYLGNCYILKKDYNAAIDAFQKYLAHLVDDKFDAELFKEVKHNIEMCKQAPELVQRSPDSASYIINGKYQPTYVKNLGSLVNTPYPEYAQVMMDHDSTILFTSRRPASQGGKREFPTDSYYEDIFVSHLDTKGQWGAPSLFSTQLQIKPSKLNLASVCISADGNTLFIFNKGLIYESHKSSKGWSKLDRVGQKIKSIKKYMPSVFLSLDGKQLFLVSNKKGGYGGRDLYVSTKDDKGIWSVPQNLGPDVNTAFDEDAPFLMPDNKTLYFSSKGHNGLGGYDIFKTVFENGKWSKPVNVGAPINSSADDVFFTYDTTAKRGYFSSSRINEGYGDMDLYSMSFTCDNIANTMLQGQVVIDGIKDVSGAHVTLTDALGQSSNFNPDPTGKYNFTLKPDSYYTIKVTFPTYLSVIDKMTTPHQCDVYNLYQVIHLAHDSGITSANDEGTPNVTSGQNVSVKNAFYRSNQTNNKSANTDPTLTTLVNSFNDKSAIWFKDSTYSVTYSKSQIDSLYPSLVKNDVKQQSTTTSVPSGKSTLLFDLNSAKLAGNYHSSLDSVAKLIKANTKIKVQVLGYADNTGTEEHNMKLSQQRANMVAQYLKSKGVKASNIRAEGKGTASPVAENDGTHNYLNRRVELIIIQ